MQRKLLNRLATFLVLLGLAPMAAFPGGVGISIPAPPDSSEGGGATFEDFHRVKPSRLGTRRFRDLEMWLDYAYTVRDSGLGVTQAEENTLDRLGKVLADSVGVNPFGIPYTDVRLVHDYFRPDSIAPYDSDPYSPHGFTYGDKTQYINEVMGEQTLSADNRGHIDYYITRPWAHQTGGRTYTGWGEYPARFFTAKEDSSTGNWRVGMPPESVVVFASNSVTIPGPDAPSILWQGGIDWTRPDDVANWVFSHEFQHGLNGQFDRFSGRLDTPWIDEVLSSGAELIAGNTDKTSRFDIPYSLPLATTPNYPAWRMFSGYLGVNFRGRDVSQTPASMQDDLLGRWARGEHSLGGLRDLLDNAVCYDCSTRTYFNPPSQPPLDNASRLRLLLHDWRVANYLNRTDIAEGRYGYTPGFDFSPFVDVTPWTNADTTSPDTEVIPPTIIVTPDLTYRSVSLLTRPPSRPMNLTTFGAEYWVLRADAALGSTSQDLVIRVTPEGARTWTAQGDACTKADDTLLGSVIPYSQHRLENGALDSLWKHPEWAGTPTEPIVVDVDSAAGALQWVIPSFGTTTRAAVVVLSLADGPSQGYSDRAQSSYGAQPMRYRLSLALRQAPFDSIDVRMLARTSGATDDHPSWSPAGDTIAYEATLPVQSSLQQIYRVPANGGTPTRVHEQDLRQSSPDWSPRGDWVAFEAESVGFSGIWVRSTTSSEAHRVTTMNCEHHWPVFQPNGQRIAYTEYGRRVGNQITENWQIRCVRPDGTEDAALTPLLGQDPPMSLRWSPDGAWLYFTRNDSLFTLSAAGGTPIFRSGLISKAGSVDPHPAEDWFALEEPGAFRGKYDCSTAANQVTFRRLAIRDTLIDDSEARFYRTSAEYFNPRWSPDGVRVAYSSDQNAPGDRDVFIGRVTYNHPPQFSSIPNDTGLTATVPYARPLSATDPDGQSLTYLAAYLPPGATLNGNIFSWLSPVVGTYYVVFRVHDGTGGVHSKVVCFTVAEYPGGGCPFVDTRTASGWVTENSVLARATDGVPRLDAYRLKATPLVKNSLLTLRLRENEQEYTALDQVRLVAVDHAPAVRAFAAGEQVWLGSRVPAARVTDQHGTDVTAMVDGEGADYYQGQPGDTLWVAMLERPSGGCDRSPAGDGWRSRHHRRWREGWRGRRWWRRWWRRGPRTPGGGDARHSMWPCWRTRDS